MSKVFSAVAALELNISNSFYNAAPSNLFTMFKSIRSKVNMQLQIQGVKTTERQIQIRKQYNGKTITNGIVIHNSDGRQMSNDKV